MNTARMPNSLRAAMTQMGSGRHRDSMRRATRWMRSLPTRSHRGPSSNPPPPQMPDVREVMAEARAKSLKVGGVTAGVTAWMETVKRYREYESGDPITFGKVWKSTVEVGKNGWKASRAASRRHISIVAIDTAARVVAWRTARKATKSSTWKIIHVVSKGVAGNAGRIFMAVEVFSAMSSDIQRYRNGDLQQPDFYRNLALTGVAITAPALGTPLGPVGATAGLTLAITAGMLRK